MSSQFSKPLFILELANNHMGDADHGVRVVREFAAVCKDFPEFTFAFKMQYRHLDTLIHPEFTARSDIKYIKRFSETRLSRDNTRRIVGAIKDSGFVPICTPFDEASVDMILEDGFEVLKVASCSFTDWPLLERIGGTNLPIIASTAGGDIRDIDNVVAFLQHRNKDFAIMHCVAAYPTPFSDLELNQIDFLRKRYPDVRIGYSTHEDPASTVPVAMAYAKGVRIFEKHVGVPTEIHSLNNYSATPAQIRAWLEAARQAATICGIEGRRLEPTKAEADSLFALRRGVYAKNDIAPGQRIRSEDIFMAIPTQDGHVTANDWSKYNFFYAEKPIKAGEPVLIANTRREGVREKIYELVQKVKDQLHRSNVIVPGQAQLEISHHYGLEKVYDYGITMITVVNREYCKKLIVILPGQKHPTQYHEQKEETFHILSGTLLMTLDGVTTEHGPGSVIVVERGVRHAFEAPRGAVFEEISSTHFVNDSFYIDPEIAKNKDRKTFLSFWMD